MDISRTWIVVSASLAVIGGASLAWINREPANTKGTPVSAPAIKQSTADQTQPILYKWQNNDGVWNFTDRPPKDRPYITVTHTPNLTVVPSVIPETAMEPDKAKPEQR